MIALPQIFLMLGIGISTGVFSGLFGIGGGVILVPILVLLFGYSQSEATGTALVALLLPVGFLGVLEYYRAGKISPLNIKIGLLFAVGIFLGAYLGARIGVSIPEKVLQRCFGVFMFLIAAKFIIA